MGIIMEELAAADSAQFMKEAAALGVAKAVGKLRSILWPAMQTATTMTNYP